MNDYFEKKNIHRAKLWFFIIWLVGTIILFGALIGTYGWFWRINYEARMSQFSVCSGLDSNGTPILAKPSITTKVKAIDVCGYLEGNGPNIPLGFFLHYNGKSITTPLSGDYQVGYITVRFVAPSGGFNTGSYQVMVYQGRHKLASTEFIIEEP